MPSPHKKLDEGAYAGPYASGKGNGSGYPCLVLFQRRQALAVVSHLRNDGVVDPLVERLYFRRHAGDIFPQGREFFRHVNFRHGATSCSQSARFPASASFIHIPGSPFNVALCRLRSIGSVGIRSGVELVQEQPGTISSSTLTQASLPNLRQLFQQGAQRPA